MPFAQVGSEASFYEKFAHTKLLTDTVAITREYQSDVDFSDLESREVLEIGLVTVGSGIHTILNQPIPCRVGDIYIINANVPHGYFVSEQGETMAVRRLFFDPKNWFEGDISSPNCSEFCHGVFSDNALTAYAMLTSRIQGEVESRLNAIGIELVERKSGWQDAIRAQLCLLLITLGRYVNRAIKNEIPTLDETEWTPVSAAMLAARESYSNPDLTLESIAEAFYISKSHLSRLFKRLTGESYSDYLKRIRLEGACRMLTETELNVDDIIVKCGLRDASSFYRAFSLHTGMTPNQYRTNNNNKNKQGEKTMSILTEISENLQKGKAKAVKELVQQAIDAGIPAGEILTEGLLAGMSIVGEKFKNNEVYVPEVLVAARAMNMGTQILKPLLAESGVTASGKVCIGTVQGDLHDIGKNLVKMMMEGKGLEVVDLGTDVPAETFVSTAIEQGCQVICCSALLTTTMSVMADVVKKAEELGVRDKIKIMVGGAPISEEFCRQIGADCYTSDAASAADAAVALCKG